MLKLSSEQSSAAKVWKGLLGGEGSVLEAPHTARLAEAALAKTLGALSWGP